MMNSLLASVSYAAMTAAAPSLGWGTVVTFERVNINTIQASSTSHNISFDQTGPYLVILGGQVGGSAANDSYWNTPTSFGGGTAVLTYTQLFGIAPSDTVENAEYESITAFAVEVTTAGTATLDIANYATHYRSFCAVYRLSAHANLNSISVSPVAYGQAKLSSQTYTAAEGSGVVSVAMWRNSTQIVSEMEATYIDGTQDVAPNEDLDPSFWYALSSRSNIDPLTNPQTVTFDQGANSSNQRDFHVFIEIPVKFEFTFVDLATTFVVMGESYTGVSLKHMTTYVVLDNP